MATLILGLAGSPRPKGNSRLLLDWFLAGASGEGARTEVLVLNRLQFRPCQACGGCGRDGECVVHDDMDQVYQALRSARGLVVSSPIHFGSLSAQTKMAVDRLQCAWAAKHLVHEPWFEKDKGRAGFLITVGGMKNGERFARNAEEVVKTAFAVLNLRYAGSFQLDRIDEAGAAARVEGLEERAREAGRDFARGLVGD